MISPSQMLLLADRSQIFRDMGSGFREKRESFEPTDLLWWLLAVAVLMAAFGCLASFLAKRDKRRLFNNPRSLFKALCAAHDLDRTSRNLLKQLAWAQHLETPARLFLEPDRFDPALAGPELAGQTAALGALRKKLFAGGPATT